MGGKQFDLRGDGPNYTLKTLNYLDLQTLFGASFSGFCGNTGCRRVCLILLTECV